MPITPAQLAVADQHQNLAAQNAAAQVRLVAGPGTGKSKVIEKRVAHVLNNGAVANTVYVISFTVAASAELRDRIATHCANQSCAAAAGGVRVSTLHALALRILRSANLLAAMYPHDPIVLDDWEEKLYSTWNWQTHLVVRLLGQAMCDWPTMRLGKRSILRLSTNRQ
jgi:DNA helicase II / ATP-dependent DNA helicase PcrA